MAIIGQQKGSASKGQSVVVASRLQGNSSSCKEAGSVGVCLKCGVVGKQKSTSFEVAQASASIAKPRDDDVSQQRDFLAVSGQLPGS